MTAATATRVLVTARDVGAAQQNRAFIDACLAAARPFEFKVLAQAPGAAVFRGCAAVEEAPAAPADEWASQAIDAFDPGFVLVGLSSFGAGVDETMLAYAKHRRIPTGAIQDYWGFLGSSAIQPDTFFVIDERARELTQQRLTHPARVEVTGSPKHEAITMPAAARRAPGSPRRVVFFLQPRDVPQLVDNVRWFLDALAGVHVPLSVALRLHPGDPDRAFYSALAAGRPWPVEITGGPDAAPIEEALLGADLVATCSSSVGLDHNYLQLRASAPLGCLAYVTIGDEMLRFMRDVIGSETVPGAETGMGVTLRSRADLEAWLPRALGGNEVREEYCRAVHANLRSAQTAAARISEYIQRQSARFR